jgi:hypothetical protein
MDKKEIRDILLGRVVQLDEQFWGVAPSDAKFHFQGLKDGAGDVRLFGVTHLTRCYQVLEMEPAIAFAAAEMALYSMGRPMRLELTPEKKACLYAPNWIAPVLLTFEQAGEQLQLTAYTGHSLLVGRIRCRIARWILEQRLPEGVVRTAADKKPVRDEAKREKVSREKPKKMAPGKTAKRAAPKKKKNAPPERLEK